MLAQSMGFALAGTFATISGTVTDDSGAPVAGAAVTAVSPSARYTATTDSHGYYSITGVTPDTYTVSFQREGYTGQVASGVVAFADQTLRVDGKVNKALRTIARVTSRSTAGAFQPGQTADTYSVNAQQIRTIQGNALNISQKNLIVSLPGASYTIGEAPSIRGGRSNNVDYEIDGVPLINPYTNGSVNNYTMPTLALQSVQVSPGNEDASFGNSGVGTVNETLKRGTYPGFADGIAGVGFPHFYHALAVGYGLAAPNGRWSDYLSYTTANTAPKYGGTLEQNSTLNGSFGDIQLVEDREFTNNFVYKFGANDRFDLQYFTDNGWHKRAAGYGMGLLYNVEVTSAGGTLIAPMCYATCNPAWTSYFGDATSAGQQVYPYWCGNYPNAGQPAGPDNFRCGDWTGLSVAQFQQMTQLYPGQSSINQTLAGRPYYQEFNENSVQKVALDYRADPRTFATLTYFNTYARAVQDSISIYPFESGDVWNLQGGYYSGVNLTGTRQLSDKHLLKLGGELYHDRPVLQTISPLTALFNPLFNGNFEYLDFIPAGQPCPGTGTTPLPGSIFYPTYGTFATDSCGYVYTQSQFNGSSFVAPPQAVNASRLKPDGGALFLDDTFTPNDRFKAQVGLRVDYRNNHLPPATVNADCTTTYLPLQWNVVPETFQNQVSGGNFDLSTGLFNNSAPLVYDAAGNVTNGKLMGPGNCPTAVFVPVTKQESNPTTYEPRLALSYRLGTNDSVRFSYGRTLRYPNLVFGDAGVSMDPYTPFAGIPTHTNNSSIVPFYATPYQLCFSGSSNPLCSGAAVVPNNPYTAARIPASCGMVSYGIAVPCTSYQEQLYWNGWNGNFGKPLMPLAPVTYSNFDFSYSHLFKGGFEFKVSPWSRRAFDLDVTSQILNPYVTPHVNPDGTKSYSFFGLLSNAGVEKSSGVEVYLTKVTPWHGFTGQITGSWQHTVQNIDPANAPIGTARDLTGTSNNENNGAISQASAGFNQFYKVNYVTPFWSSLALQYETPKGDWRFQTQWFYDVGYPYGAGFHVLQVFNGQPQIVVGSNDCANSVVNFADPTNPGSCLKPNIVATRGTNEGDFANQALTHPNLTAALTIEKTVGSGRLGFTINNLFNEIYTGPTIPNGIDYGHTGPILSDSFGFDYKNGLQLNPAYQPVATGVSGPLTGQGGGLPVALGSLLCSTCAYIHLPKGEGRTYYVYYQFRIGGSRL